MLLNTKKTSYHTFRLFIKCLAASILGVVLTASLAAPSAAKTLLVLGDSLSSEYGIPRGSGWVHLLEQKLSQANISTKVINVSVSGETTSGALQRVSDLLARVKPSIVLLELGANDALRGMSVHEIEKNLSQLVMHCQRAGAVVVLLENQIPPNFGRDYAWSFREIYARVAKKYQALLVPFFLKDIAQTPNRSKWFQSDGVHPTEAAQNTLMLNVWRVIRKIVR